MTERLSIDWSWKSFAFSGDKILLENPNLRSQRIRTNFMNKSLRIVTFCLGLNWWAGHCSQGRNDQLSKNLTFWESSQRTTLVKDAGVWRLYLVLLCKPTLRGEAVWDSIGQRWAHWAESHELCSPAQGHKRHRSLQGIDHHILLDKDLQAFNPI